MLYPLAQRSEAYQQWHRFCENGITEGVRDSIKASWLRCREHGLDPTGHSSPVAGDSLSLEVHETTPESVKQLVAAHYQAVESHLVIPFTFIFVDSDFRISHMYGNEKILDRFAQHSLCEGGDSDEKSSGTNAPALCLIEKKPVTVTAEEHFLKDFHWARCLALPVFDQQQRMAGSLCMTTDAEYRWTLETLSEYLYGLAHSLGFHLFVEEKARRREIQESYFRATFEHADQAMLLVNRCGDIMALNWAAQRLLKLPPLIAFSKNIRELVQIQHEDRSLYCLSKRPELVKLRLPASGNALFSMETIPLAKPASDRLAYILKLLPEKAYTAVKKSPAGTAGYTFMQMVAEAPKTLDLLYQAKRAAATSASVLIEGETGTGKELLAQAIHNESPYRLGPFVAVNCAAIPQELIESDFFGYERGAYTGAKKEGAAGKFELANSGSIFLDEIQAMPHTAQIKLLRVLQERTVMRLGGSAPVFLDFRVIAASSVTLRTRVEKGAFLDALYYRLNVLKLAIPPLRERIQEIVPLCKTFIQDLNKESGRTINGISEDVLEIFKQYPWPGNVRELRNCVEYAFTFCEGGLITQADLGSRLNDLMQKLQQKERGLEGVTKKLMLEALAAYPTVAEAASHIGMSTSTFYRKMKKFGLSK